MKCDLLILYEERLRMLRGQCRAVSQSDLLDKRERAARLNERMGFLINRMTVIRQARLAQGNGGP